LNTQKLPGSRVSRGNERGGLLSVRSLEQEKSALACLHSGYANYQGI
jgi:hypothetical protein